MFKMVNFFYFIYVLKLTQHKQVSPWIHLVQISREMLRCVFVSLPDGLKPLDLRTKLTFGTVSLRLYCTNIKIGVHNTVSIS